MPRPSCIRRFAWTQAAHNNRSWQAGRTTDLDGRTSPDGRTFTDHPPRASRVMTG